MQISNILSKQAITLDGGCNSKKDALDTLAKAIALSDNEISQKEVFDCLIARERLGSTGLGRGVAIPHGRLKESKKTLAAFLRLENAIDYDSTGEKTVDLIFALVVPEDSTEEHLKILSSLAEKFSNESVVNKLRTSKMVEDVFFILTG